VSPAFTRSTDDPPTRRTRAGRRRAALVAPLVAVLVAGAVVSGIGVPGFRSTTTVTARADSGDEFRQAEALRQQATARAGQLTDAQAKLSALSDAANAALSADALARDQLAQAKTALVAAQAEQDAAQQRLKTYAMQAYMEGPGSELANAMTVISSKPSEIGFNTAVLDRISDVRNTALVTAQEARTKVAAAEQAAETSQTVAETTKKQADAAFAAQQTQVTQIAADKDRLFQQADATQQQAIVLKQQEDEAARQAELAREAAARAAVEAAMRAQAEADALANNALAASAGTAKSSGSSDTSSSLGSGGSLVGASGGTPSCDASVDFSKYANGQLPFAALCPLYGYSYHVLRPDAAAAFNKLSHAYEAEFGHPIVVTDSYRSYGAQVICRQTKGELCAVPGTSNHGYARAVDLGDGVNSFTSDTFAWMKQNAPKYGWFHPSWAEASGAKPEPWHWEYNG
jgi:D-alanyl-D-alanine carboxypeptidase